MPSKTFYLLLAFAVTIAAVTAYWDDDDDEDDDLFDFEEMMEKRGKRPKWKKCPDKPHCLCIIGRGGNIKQRGVCGHTRPVGI